uniref:GDSL esterase/lipase At2g04570-like n=1 Tax=Ananas comosus var. bracteatus TaxID=296719 RepID=A0A6V7PLF4_ANACO|nr:unnamed protein product [Ananas comosus var. bracteatus]
MSLEHYSQWLLSVQLLLLYSMVATASKVPALIVFGDSSVDSGNNNYIQTVARSNFRPYGRDLGGGSPTGRFSNGRLTTDFLSEALGLPRLVPAYLNPNMSVAEFASGVCFASAGTGYDNATSDVLSVIPLWKELEYFKEYREKLKSFQGEAKAQETLSEALYVISLGTNDFVENYYVLPHRPLQFTVAEYEDFLVGIAEEFVRSIYKLGARKVELTGLPPMGCLPLERAKINPILGGCYEEYNKVAWDFNIKLQKLVDNLNQNLAGIRIVYGDVYDILFDAVQNSSSYGFENVMVGCCGTGLFEMSYMCNRRSPFTCSDANKYAFWDSMHPTERLNNIIADKLMNTTLHVFL